jgi:hypothetical protein
MNDSEHHCGIEMFGREVDAVWELSEECSTHRFLDKGKLHRVLADPLEDLAEFCDKPCGKSQITLGVPIDRVADIGVGFGRDNDLRHGLGFGRELTVKLSANVGPRSPRTRVIPECDETVLNEFSVPSRHRDGSVCEHGIP